jgi:hypothetical protein
MNRSYTHHLDVGFVRHYNDSKNKYKNHHMYAYSPTTVKPPLPCLLIALTLTLRRLPPTSIVVTICEGNEHHRPWRSVQRRRHGSLSTGGATDTTIQQRRRNPDGATWWWLFEPDLAVNRIWGCCNSVSKTDQ